VFFRFHWTIDSRKTEMPSTHDELALRRIGKPFTAIVLICSIGACSDPLNTPGGLVVPELGPIDYTSALVSSPLQVGWPDDLKKALTHTFADEEAGRAAL